MYRTSKKVINKKKKKGSKTYVIYKQVLKIYLKALLPTSVSCQGPREQTMS